MKSPKLTLFIPGSITARRVVLLWTVLVCLVGQATAEDAAKNAYDYLAGILVDKTNSVTAIRAFHAANDRELTPLFVAMSRGGDKKMRMMATMALGKLGGKEAIAALKNQLVGDSAMGVRAEAMVNLLKLKAADTDVLTIAVKLNDQNIQCVAARSLAVQSKDKKHQELARTTLQKLAKSNDPMTAAMAGVGLLAMGDSAQLPGLKKFISDPDTEAAIVRLMMLQIADEKIAAGQPLARMVVDSPKLSVETRIIACRALAAASPRSVPVIFASLRKSRSMVYRIRAMGIIAEQAGAQPYITAIAKSSLLIGPLAGFEQSRTAPGPASSLAVDKALALKHPIAVDYVLRRAEEDIKKLGDRAAFYVAPLLKYIASVEPDTDRMAQEHILAAQATTLLTNLGTPKAIAGIDKILAGRYSAITRSTAAGLLRATNKAVCPLARKLLKSPYQELATDGALTLGHFADPAATEYFNRIITRQSGHAVAEITLASWYLLKIRKLSTPTAQQLAKLIK